MSAVPTPCPVSFATRSAISPNVTALGPVSARVSPLHRGSTSVAAQTSPTSRPSTRLMPDVPSALGIIPLARAAGSMMPSIRVCMKPLGRTMVNGCPEAISTCSISQCWRQVNGPSGWIAELVPDSFTIRAPVRRSARTIRS